MADLQEPYDFDYDPYSLPPAFLRAIGLVTAAAAQTENFVEELIAGCLGIDFEYGMAVTLHMSMPQRFNAARAAAEIKLDDLDALDELDDLLDRTEKAFEGRNTVVHNELAVEHATGRVFLVKQTARGRVESDVREITSTEIEATAKELYDVGLVLFTFAKNHGLLASLPPGPRPRHHKSRAARKMRRKALLNADAINRKTKPG
jgi:hypothetical protein